MVGDNTDLIVLLLHKTKDIELNTAQLFFEDIYEGHKSSSESLKLTQNTGCQLLSWRTLDSNVPKAVEVASVIAAEILPPTFHAAYLNYIRAYLQV